MTEPTSETPLNLEASSNFELERRLVSPDADLSAGHVCLDIAGSPRTVRADYRELLTQPLDKDCPA